LHYNVILQRLQKKGFAGGHSGSGLATRLHRGSSHIGLGEIRTLEKQRFTGRAGERIREAIAKVEAGGVSPLTEAAEGVDHHQEGRPFSSYPKISSAVRSSKTGRALNWAIILSMAASSQGLTSCLSF
jgi:hypothetical protein